jgi:hypothetical protein
VVCDSYPYTPPSLSDHIHNASARSLDVPANMDFIIGTSGEEIDFDAWEFPFSEVVDFELGVDADRPVCLIVVDAGVVEDAGLRNVVVFEAIRDGEVADIRVFAGVRKAEVGDGERFVGAGY